MIQVEWCIQDRHGTSECPDRVVLVHSAAGKMMTVDRSQAPLLSAVVATSRGAVHVDQECLVLDLESALCASSSESRESPPSGAAPFAMTGSLECYSIESAPAQCVSAEHLPLLLLLVQTGEDLQEVVE